MQVHQFVVNEQGAIQNIVIPCETGDLRVILSVVLSIFQTSGRCCIGISNVGFISELVQSIRIGHYTKVVSTSSFTKISPKYEHLISITHDGGIGITDALVVIF